MRCATPVKPTRQPVRLSQRPGPAKQDEERRLESIVSVSKVPQDAATDAEDHRPVSANDLLERDRVPTAGECLHKIGVRPAGRRGRRNDLS